MPKAKNHNTALSLRQPKIRRKATVRRNSRITFIALITPIALTAEDFGEFSAHLFIVIDRFIGVQR
jgi:hypothetical protein